MLTVKRAAEILNVSRGLVYALVATGKLPSHRFGIGRGTIRIREEDLADYQTRAKGGIDSPTLTSVGSFNHLDAIRLAKAWRKRGVL
jgi:excisionase family DNA binding protein